MTPKVRNPRRRTEHPWSIQSPSRPTPRGWGRDRRITTREVSVSPDPERGQQDQRTTPGEASVPPDPQGVGLRGVGFSVHVASTPRGESARPGQGLSPSRPTPPGGRHDRWKGAALEAHSTAATQQPGAFNARHRNDVHVATVAVRITGRTSTPPRRATPTAVHSKRRPRPEQRPEGQRHSTHGTAGARSTPSRRHQRSTDGAEEQAAMPLQDRENQTTAQFLCHHLSL